MYPTSCANTHYDVTTFKLMEYENLNISRIKHDLSMKEKNS